MGLFAKFASLHENFLKRKEDKARYILIQDSITCRCGGMAIPLSNTTNKYMCVKCQKRFANARHNIDSKLGDVLINFSGLVLEKLISEHK